MRKILIAGSRDLYPTIKEIDYAFHQLVGVKWPNDEDEVVCGLARGVDSQGERWGMEYGITVRFFPAHWDEYGKSAGYRRNAEMVDYCTHGLVFWDRKSRGTKHTISLLEKSEKPWLLI